jgi:protease IV
MKQFFKFTFASILGFFISLLLLLFIFFVFSFAIISSLDSVETVSISNNTILEIKLDYEVPERTSFEPIFSLSIIPSIDKTIGLNDITRIIEHAKGDHKIKGIYLDLDNFYVGGLAKINTIRDALLDFKSSDKFIIAHGNSISEKGYYLASVADSIYLTPTGNFEFDGFGIEVAFYKDALRKLEIEPQIFQYGKFKSATEPFRFDKLSNDNKKQLEAYLNSVYTDYISNISQSTNINHSTLISIANELMTNSAEDAEKLGLVSSLLYEDEVDSLINNMIDSSLKVKKVSEKKYLYSIRNNSSSSANRVAIIYALGEIVNSGGDEFTIGTKNIIKSIRKAKENKRVKAIVMRVNSPGGSPLTSDMIWREIKLASKEKPFIVSMGEMAASGGYYISCPADIIVADPSTLAGSIGVYGIIPNTQKFFNNKLGIKFDRVETGENSSLLTITTPMSNEQKRYFQEQVDNIYYDFVSRVAEGRNMTFDEIDRIAEGRIWSGIDSKNIGLVDTLGGLDLAINIAAEQADIDNYKIIEYPAQKETFEKIMELLSSEIESKINNFTFERSLNQIQNLSNALKYTGIQTRLPFEYVIY